MRSLRQIAPDNVRQFRVHASRAQAMGELTIADYNKINEHLDAILAISMRVKPGAQNEQVLRNEIRSDVLTQKRERRVVVA